jgi:energy-coupling factor transporter ATP-binding protein EcfA2
MSADNFLVLDFRPLFLTVEGVGPFQEAPFELDFTDSNGEPCNFFLLMSQNGRGKTTLLEAMTALMGLLEQPEPAPIGFEDLDNGAGRAQWDLLVRLYRDGREETLVMSLAAGRDEPWTLKPWGESLLQSYGADRWCPFGLQRHTSGRLEVFGENDERIQDLLAAICAHMGEAPVVFEDDPLAMPTLLSFSAYRDIARVTEGDRGIMQPGAWGYRPVQRFGQESRGWKDSLDNLLVWLSWLDDGRYEQALKTINERIFAGSTKFLRGVRKDPPQAVVENGKDHRHRLDRLSSGEKSLVQIYLRAGVHMTRSTILVIDEMDIHLHSKWQHRLLNILKQMAKDHPGLTIIASSHARELIPAFAHDIEEPGLRKAGEIIEAGLG